MKKKLSRRGAMPFFYRVARKASLSLLALVTVFCCLSTRAYAQASRGLTIRAAGTSLSNVIKEIENQSDYRFFYNESVDLKVQVSGDFTNKTVEEIMDKLLANTTTKYKLLGQQIALYNKGEMEPVLTERQHVITGKVTDAKGDPLSVVGVVLKGTQTGVLTNNDGMYSITVPTGMKTPVLLFSFIGFVEKEIEVGRQTVINLTMEEDVSKLDEVVVVGYGTQKKVNLTGSVTSVKTEQLNNIPAANLSNTIAGRAPGITAIGTSGLAGASSSIRVRGSFAEPLYVINGIIKSKADFDALDANEVESINFLKDAASASIYGSKAGNGVVLITTKAGIIQKPSMEYKGSFTTARTTRPIQSYTATQEIEFVNRIAESQGLDRPYGSEIYEYFKDKSYDINDYIWQNPSIQQHNLGLRGGSEHLNYYMSAGLHSEKGSYKKLNYDRYNLRSDVSAKITERLKVNVNLSGHQRDYSRWYWPYDGAEDFNVGDFYRATFNWSRLYPFYVEADGTPANHITDYPVVPGAWHPVELMTNGGYRDIRYRTLDGIIRFDLDLGALADGLSTSLQAHYTASDRNMKAFVLHNKAYLFQSGDANNKFIPEPVNPDKLVVHNLSATYPNISETVDLTSAYQINWYLRYEKTLAKHSLSALAVYEQAGDKGKFLEGRADDLLTTSIDQIYNSSSDISKRWFDGKENESARVSWIGRLNYSYASKYILEYSFRYDGNYRFAKGHQWGFFPSVSAAWRISEEGFLKSDWLSNMKLRASYGTTGSDDGISPFTWSQTYSKSTGFVFGNSYSDGLVPGKMPNPTITWSTVKMYNAGLDFGLLKNRLAGELDVFSKKQTNILGERTGSTPSTLGATLPAVNYAARSWKGFELSLNWMDKIGDFNYSIYTNMGYARDQWDVYDEAVAYTDGTYKDNWRSKIGKPENRLYGLKSKGIIRTQEELDRIPDGFNQYGRKPKLGYLLFEDIRGDNYSEGPDGKIDDNDMTYLSDNANPRINYGFGFRLEWKGIMFTAHFQGVGAYDRIVSTRNGGGVFQVDRPYFELWAHDYWTPENPNAKYPRATGEWMAADVGGASSTFWMRNGAYLRLKNLDISYTLPQKWYSRLGVGRVQLFANATNLFCISGIAEHDPEQNTLDSYPLMKLFTGGLSVSF